MPVLLSLPARFRALLLVALLAAGTPAPLHAHLKLVRSTPAAGDTLRVAPIQLLLVFSERPELRFTVVRLTGPGGREIALDVPAQAIEGAVGEILVPIRERLGAGEYTVSWQTGSSDGHPIRGRFRFVVAGDGAGAPVVPPAGGATAGAIPGAAAGANDSAHGHDAPLGVHDSTQAHQEEEVATELPFVFRVGRWIEFGALLLLVGTVVYSRYVLPSLAGELAPPRADALRRARAIGLTAGAVLLAASLARLFGHTAAMHGAPGALDPGNLGGMVWGTRWGLGWASGVLGALITIVAIATARDEPPSRLAGLGAIAASAAPAFTGHAVATGGWLHVPAVSFDLLHVVGAAAWLGTLATIALAGVPAALAADKGIRHQAVARQFLAFHPIGLAAVGAVLLSGIGSSWIRLGSIAQLTMSNYGSVLLFKVYAFLFVGLVGLYNWKKVLPRLGDSVGTHRIRRSVVVELVIGIVVLAMTALLVVTEPPN